MILTYLIAFISAFILSVFFTPLVKKVALKRQIVDNPNTSRKIHQKSVPLMGGLAVFLSFLLVVVVMYFLNFLSDGVIEVQQILALVLGGAILIIGGFFDDKYNLKPWQSFLFPLGACFLAVLFGINIEYVTNPFFAGSGPYGRALFYFDWINLEVMSFASVFAFLWLIGMIYTTKILDGLDGLVSGIGAIAAFILFLVSLFWDVPMSATSILCLIFCGSLLGFLIFNWHPAKIFLGEGGATFVGFMLGSLSIISGGKIATALLIMGLPILDTAWTIFRRIMRGQHFFQPDRRHLHFRLLDAGLSQPQAVTFLYLVAASFGLSSLFLQSRQKAYALLTLFILAVLLLFYLYYILQQKKNKKYEKK